MAVAPANTWGTNWQQGVGGASQSYIDGINNTTVDVVGKAIANQAALLANFQQAVTSGEWARRLAAVGTAGWKQAAKDKAANYTNGAAAGLARYQNFAQQAQPFWTNASQAIDGMASGNKAAAMARVGAWYDAMQTFKQSYTP
jgi:spermidine/putrescine-binding protein